MVPLVRSGISNINTGSIDASGDCAQSTLENRGQTKFSRKLRVKILFFEGLIFIATQHSLIQSTHNLKKMRDEVD
jgi:hypothetical protein